MPNTDLDTRKSAAESWFQSLQQTILARFEALEIAAGAPIYKGAPGRAELTEWKRPPGPERRRSGRWA